MNVCNDKFGKKYHYFFAKGSKSREKILSPRVAIILAQMLPGLFRRHLLISPLGTTSLQNTYYSKTQWMVLSRKKQLLRKTPPHSFGKCCRHVGTASRVRVDSNVTPASLLLSSAARQQFVRCLHFLQQTAGILFSASVCPPNPVYYIKSDYVLSLPPVIGYYLFAYWKTTKVGIIPFPNSTNQLTNYFHRSCMKY